MRSIFQIILVFSGAIILLTVNRILSEDKMKEISNLIKGMKRGMSCDPVIEQICGNCSHAINRAFRKDTQIRQCSETGGIVLISYVRNNCLHYKEKS